VLTNSSSNLDNLPAEGKFACVEAASDTSSAFLRTVGGGEKGPQCLGCNRASQFVGDVNGWTWSSSLGKRRI
jgi:hypothetical protein